MPGGRLSNLGEAAKAVIKEFPDAPAKQLARILKKRHPRKFRDIEHARDTLRYHLGVMGDKKRKCLTDKSGTRPARKAGQQKECPPSLYKEYVPHFLDGPKRLLVLSDIHYPYHAIEPLKVAVQCGLDEGCDALLINGDGADFYAISRWERDPDKRHLVEELTGFQEMLDWLIECFPDTTLKIGNHEERWDNFIWNRCEELWGMKGLRLDMILKEVRGETGRVDRYLEFDLIGEGRPVMFSGLPIYHGHELGGGGTVNPARSTWLKTWDTSLQGHVHKTSENPESKEIHLRTGTERDEMACWSTGCLCGLNPRWLRRNKWNWGFAIVEANGGDEFTVHNRRINRRLGVR